MLGSVTVPTPIGVGVHVSFGPNAGSIASGIVPSVVQSALSGNLTAWKCIDERQTIGVDSERKVWVAAWQQITTQRPDLLAAYNQNKSKLPAIIHTSTQSAANSALSNPVSASGTGTPNASTAAATNAVTTAASNALASVAGFPLWLTLLLAGALGYVVYKAVKK